MSDRGEVEVVDAPAADRFEARVGGELAGILAYRIEPDRIVLLHTETREGFEGRGVGGRLVQAALDAARARSRPVEPQCPFAAGYIRRHPDLHGLVVAGFDLGADAG